RADIELAGAGALYNLGVHALDAVLYLVGESVAQVVAVTAPPGAILDRTILVIARFRSGVLANIQASQELPEDDVGIELLGERGTIRWAGWMAPYRSGMMVIDTASGRRAIPSECPDAYERAIAHFTT